MNFRVQKVAASRRRQQQPTSRPLSLTPEEGAPLSPRSSSSNASPEEEEEDKNFGAGQSGAPNQESDQEEDEVKVEENVERRFSLPSVLL